MPLESESCVELPQPLFAGRRDEERRVVVALADPLHRLVQQPRGQSAAAECPGRGYAVDVGRASEAGVERHEVQHRGQLPVDGGGHGPAPRVVADDEAVDELLLVAEGLRPQLLAGQFVGMQAHGRELVLQEGRVVGEFRLPQSVDAHVLLAVDERETLREVLGEELVDDREGPVELRVGLLDVRVEGVVVERRSVGEGRQAVADMDAASHEPQLVEVLEGPEHGPLLGVLLRGVLLLAGLAPLAFEGHALVEMLRGELLVAVIGVFGHEAVDVVALGLVAVPCEVAEILGAVDVILQRAVRLEGECPGVHVAHLFARLVREADQAQALPPFAGILEQLREDRRKVPRADRLHVSDALAALDVEADDEKSPDLGPRGVVDLLPAVHVCERKVVVADAPRHRVAFDGRAVFQPHGFEINHRR